GDTSPTVPMLAAAWPSAVQIWRVNAATDVLPLVPVTAAIICGWREKNFAAVSAKARRASATLMNATPSGSGVAGGRSAMMAAAHRGGAAAGERVRDEVERLFLRPRPRHEQIARLDGAAVGVDAGEVERGEARVGDGIRGEEIDKLHGNAVSTVQPLRGFRMVPTDTRCLPKTEERQRPTGRLRSPESTCRRAASQSASPH